MWESIKSTWKSTPTFKKVFFGIMIVGLVARAVEDFSSHPFPGSAETTTVETVSHDGHVYVVAHSRHAMSMIHSPSCPCARSAY